MGVSGEDVAVGRVISREACAGKVKARLGDGQDQGSRTRRVWAGSEVAGRRGRPRGGGGQRFGSEDGEGSARDMDGDRMVV